VTRIAKSQDVCLGSGLQYNNYELNPMIQGAYGQFDTMASPPTNGAFANALKVGEHHLMPQNYINCPGMVVMYGYIGGWVNVSNHPSPDTCSEDVVKISFIMQEMFQAERALGMDPETASGMGRWGPAMQGSFSLAFSKPLGSDVHGTGGYLAQAFADDLFARMQAISIGQSHMKNLVYVMLGTMWTHLYIIGKMQNIELTMIVKEPFADALGLASGAIVNIHGLDSTPNGSSNSKALKGKMLGPLSENLYNSTMNAVNAACPFC